VGDAPTAFITSTNVAGHQQRQRPAAGQIPLAYRPLCDGVFRAVPPTIANAKDYCGKVLQQVADSFMQFVCHPGSHLLP
jgi:hypothetical protein